MSQGDVVKVLKKYKREMTLEELREKLKKNGVDANNTKILMWLRKLRDLWGVVELKRITKGKWIVKYVVGEKER